MMSLMAECENLDVAASLGLAVASCVLLLPRVMEGGGN